jgi:hypothetical protein
MSLNIIIYSLHGGKGIVLTVNDRRLTSEEHLLKTGLAAIQKVTEQLLQVSFWSHRPQYGDLRAATTEHANEVTGRHGDFALTNVIDPAIAKATRPLAVRFKFCNLGDAGAKALADSIKASSTLMGVEVSLNPDISEAGYMAIKQAAVASKSPLESLCLITCDGIEERTSRTMLITAGIRALGSKPPAVDDLLVSFVAQLLVHNAHINDSDAERYAALLVERGFDSRAALETLDEDDLRKCGIGKPGHVKLILKAAWSGLFAESSSSAAAKPATATPSDGKKKKRAKLEETVDLDSD